MKNEEWHWFLCAIKYPHSLFQMYLCIYLKSDKNIEIETEYEHSLRGFRDKIGMVIEYFGICVILEGTFQIPSNKILMTVFNSHMHISFAWISLVNYCHILCGSYSFSSLCFYKLTSLVKSFSRLKYPIPFPIISTYLFL